MNLKSDAKQIIEYSINQVKPNEAVRKALEGKTFSNGKKILVAIGKAAYEMAKSTVEIIDIDEGIVISKYGHIKSSIKNCEMYEAGHPISDENTFKATKRALEITENLSQEDTVIFLVSGGGSALFEDSYLSLEELQDINDQLLKSGASINEINTIRKRLSKVKGGKFALHCKPAHIFSIVLSDIINDPLDMIASGPAYGDSSSCQDALNIIDKYSLSLSDEAMKYINIETPKNIEDVETIISGSVKQLCLAAYNKAKQLGYKPIIIKDNEQGIAKDVGKQLALLANKQEPGTCLIMGGETVVKITGNGKGGRNQELALSAARFINDNVALFSLGSDGSDGPTDAAGGYIDKDVINKIKELNINIDSVLDNNDSYNTLKQVDGLIITGPTGTNVNDLMVALIS